VPSDNLEIRYDRLADVLYITRRAVPARSKEVRPGMYLRYGLDRGDVVGLTILDYSTYWRPRFEELVDQVAQGFSLPREVAQSVLTRQH
jgi:hypothetical protein